MVESKNRLNQSTLGLIYADLCFTSASLMLHCFTSASPMFHLCFTCGHRFFIFCYRGPPEQGGGGELVQASTSTRTCNDTCASWEFGHGRGGWAGGFSARLLPPLKGNLYVGQPRRRQRQQRQRRQRAHTPPPPPNMEPT